VTAISNTDAWAAGQRYLANGYTRATLILHWNGSRWSRVTSPDPGIFHNFLEGISAATASDVWAVGEEDNPGLGGLLTLHWDGHSWSNIPNNFASGNPVVSVGANPRGGAWIAGYSNGGGCALPVLLHWKNGKWSQTC